MYKPWLIGGLTLGIATSVFYWSNGASEVDNQFNAHSEKMSTSLSSGEGSGLLAPTNSASQTDAMPTPEEFEASEQIAEQVEDALMQYEEFSKYPPNSQPILSERHVHAFVNTSMPQSSLPFPFDDLENPIQVSIELDQNNYFFGDPIRAKVNIGQAPEGSNISTRAVLMNIEGDVIAESGYQESKENTTYIVFDTQSYSTENWPIEMNVGAYIDVNGRNIFISAPFKINNETASLESIGYSEPVAENLVIPVNLNVELAGYYHVAAVLYSSKTANPLVHLEAEGPLSEGIGNLELKAHIQALKKANDEGPYYLDKIRIQRWSDETIPRDIAGKVSQDEYQVEGYSFNDYEDKPYLDPLAEERKRLLQGLSSRL